MEKENRNIKIREFQFQIIKGLSLSKKNEKHNNFNFNMAKKSGKISKEALALQKSKSVMFYEMSKNSKYRLSANSSNSSSISNSPTLNSKQSLDQPDIGSLDLNDTKFKPSGFNLKRITSRKFNRKNSTIRPSTSLPSLTMITATSPPTMSQYSKKKHGPPVPPRSLYSKNHVAGDNEDGLDKSQEKIESEKIENSKFIDINNSIDSEYSNEDESFPDTSELDSIGSSVPSTPTVCESVSGSSSKKNSLTLQQMEMNSLATLNELLTTEEDYLRDLDYVIQEVMMPMKKKKYSKSTIESIFSNIEIIRNISSTLISDLKGTGNDINLKNTIKIFKKLHAFLKMYSQYCKNHSKALLTIEELCKSNSGFCQFLIETSYLPQARGLRLQDYLIKPIQRICKYPLLFNEILKYTSADDQDYSELKDVHMKLSEVAEFINDFQKIDETNEKLIKLQTTLEGVPYTIVEASRRYLRDCPVKVDKSLLLKDQNDQRHLYIFNDTLVLARTKKVSNRMYFSLSLPFHSLTVEASSGSNGSSSIKMASYDIVYPKLVALRIELLFANDSERDDIFAVLYSQIAGCKEMQKKLKSRGSLDMSSASQIWLDGNELGVDIQCQANIKFSKASPQPTQNLQNALSSSSPNLSELSNSDHTSSSAHNNANHSHSSGNLSSNILMNGLSSLKKKMKGGHQPIPSFNK